MDSKTRLAMDELSFANRRRCCFWVPWSGSKSWERIAVAAEDRTEEPGPTKGRWWWTTGLKALMKLREWSEKLAGPRWKTFIRRVGRHTRRPGSRFGYDPLSYALNFDDGMDNETEDAVARRGFPALYAAPPSSTKASMVLGGRAPPPIEV
uniref:Uncharacterized protein LOC105060257 n=1 Tax=Elaeis guineensis var. tenera TaxID=51953 RepID=A0A6I9SFG9_ELAGV|nr:uncharacterized protein LOC105060257 [Elaeis guineensis]